MSEAKLKPRRAVVAPPPSTMSLPAPAWVLLTLIAAVVMVVSVTFPIFDPDIWQHLLVGKAIWQMHAVPAEHLWTWPTYGRPDITPSWLFRVALWPFWALGGVHGLFAWRWLTILLTFGLLWKAARAAGARGPWVLLGLVWCALLYRHRSQARPETFVAIFLAAQFWLLERRRAIGAGRGARDLAWLLVPIAWAWANAHISYYITFVVTGAYLLEALRTTRNSPVPQRPGQLVLIMLAGALASMLNPYGLKLLAQPFEYFFVWRHEAIYQNIDELSPLQLSLADVDALPLWLLLLGVLTIWRWRARRFDLAQLLLLLLFVPQAISTSRFVGTLAVIVAPFFARDLDETMNELWPRALRSAPVLAGSIGILMIALLLPSFRDEALKPGYGIRWDFYPVRACDWIASHGVRGRGFNVFGQGGYLLWRFYPERSRLPFMDIHQTGTKQDRYLAAWAMQDARAWKALDDEHRFDWVMVPPSPRAEPGLPDFMDADTTTWALVFTDDAASIWLRRGAALAALAERERFRWVPGGRQRLDALGDTVAADTVVRGQVRAELDRQIAYSPWSGHAHSLHANVELADARWKEALEDLAAVRRLRPESPLLAEREKIARDSLAAQAAQPGR